MVDAVFLFTTSALKVGVVGVVGGDKGVGVEGGLVDGCTALGILALGGVVVYTGGGIFALIAIAEKDACAIDSLAVGAEMTFPIFLFGTRNDKVVEELLLQL